MESITDEYCTCGNKKILKVGEFVSLICPVCDDEELPEDGTGCAGNRI
jgi:hypothetical protein